jgi:hypothetical protein
VRRPPRRAGDAFSSGCTRETARGVTRDRAEHGGRLAESLVAPGEMVDAAEAHTDFRMGFEFALGSRTRGP